MILYRYEIWSWYSLLNISGVFYVYNIIRNDKTYHSVFVGSHFLKFETFFNYYFYGHPEIGLECQTDSCIVLKKAKQVFVTFCFC